jgi:hypothetical protein
MFDFDKIIEPYKSRVINKYNSYKPTFNKKIKIKHETNDRNSAISGSGSYNKYGLYDGNGYAIYSRYDSEFKNGVKV